MIFENRIISSLQLQSEQPSAPAIPGGPLTNHF